MNCRPPQGRNEVPSVRLIKNALAGAFSNKEHHIKVQGPNFDGKDNLEEGRSRRSNYPHRYENYNRTNYSDNGRGKLGQGTYHTPYRGYRGNAYKYCPARNNHYSRKKFSQEKNASENYVAQSRNLPFSDSSSRTEQCNSLSEKSNETLSDEHVAKCVPAQTTQSINADESSPDSDFLESCDITAPPYCEVGYVPTTEVIASNCAEQNKVTSGLQDGSSGYGSCEDVSSSGGLCCKEGENDAKKISPFDSSSLSESSLDYIPPPTPRCSSSCNRTEIFERISCREENENISTPPLPASITDTKELSRGSGTMPECSVADDVSISDSVEGAIEPVRCKRICQVNPDSSDITVTVLGEDLQSDEDDETSEEASSVHGSLNSMDMAEEQIEAISKLLLNVEKERASTEYDTWEEVTGKLIRVVKKCIRGYWLQPFGSYVSRFAIGTSNMNIALIPSKHLSSSHKMLQEMVRPIQREIPHCDPIFDGNQDYRSASVTFLEPKSNICCKIQILGNGNLCLTAKLLHRYGELDPRVKTLIITVRHWAEICDIHDVDNGRLHPLSYILMMIHFLQQCDPPVLPVIPVLNHRVQEKMKEVEPLQDNKQEVGYLWVEFLKYYHETFNWKDNVVSITSKDPVLKASKPWGKCWMAIEEPHDKDVNVAKSVVSQDVSNYIRMVFGKTYNYFLHPVSPDELEISCDLTEDSNNHDVSQETKGQNQPCYDYDFNEGNFLDGLYAPVVCSECEHLGHLCDACLHDESSMLYRLPEMTAEFLHIIDESLKETYEKYSLTLKQLNDRANLVERLERHLKKRLKKCKVELIGSSKSGFGLKDSDIDLCFTLEGKSAEDVDSRIMVKKIKNILCTNPHFTDVVYITSSKIPIVKFIDRKTGLRCDISIYNELALYNTRLLYAYSMIDERVKILGCAMKIFAKNACINDTAQRTLSSYSYVLMVLYFLQQVEPPVIPVLQELYDSSKPKPKHVVENEDVWFYEDIGKLSDIWDGSGKNQQSVGELWVGLLEFYTTKFTYRHFISISQKNLLTELENVSSSMLFNIQDPFIKSLNLGSRMSGDMSRRTLKALQRARILFGTPVPTAKPPSGFESFQDYFFSTMNLTDGKVMGKIECSLCGKYGHSEERCRRHKLNPYRFRSNVPQKAPF